MILSEATVQGRACLVLDPPLIPPGAPVIVTLHGLGANSDDLVPFCEGLGLSGCRFVLPDAPMHLPGYPEDAFAWYDFQLHDRQQIEASRDHLFKVLDRFAQDPNLRPAPGSSKTPTPLVLMGFSQGGVMALEAGLNYKGKIAAVVSMSGYMPDPWATLTKSQASFETPILLVHGSQDTIVPPEGSRAAADAMKQTGYSSVELKLFPMPHTISEESMGEVSRFLKDVLKV